ncbi:MAG TPA: chemotaxis protein CheW, partial [Phototrophicaceae bacterium]|nr:chemotaxis protein CheW [Phototrophicaceae bacterium]
QDSMSVVIEQQGELFSLIIDSVGDVIDIERGNLEHVPATLNSAWRTVASSIYKLHDKLLVILDVRKLLEIAQGNQI